MPKYMAFTTKPIKLDPPYPVDCEDGFLPVETAVKAEPQANSISAFTCTCEFLDEKFTFSATRDQLELVGPL